MAYAFESEVAKALGELLDAEVNYDVIIHIGKEPDYKEFHAHSAILCCRSNYFNSVITAKDIEKEDGRYIIKKPNINVRAFEVIIRYLYAGHIDFNNKTGPELLDIMIASNELKLQLSILTENFNIENYDLFLRNDFAPQASDEILKYLYIGQMDITDKTGNELFDIMVAADKLNLKHLTTLIEDILIGDHYQFLQENSVRILKVVYQHQTLECIREFCLEPICYEPEMLFSSAEFTKLPAPVLEVILKRDDLNLAEVDVWENIIKWGLAQEEIQNNDVTNWKQDEFDALKEVINRFIPFVRFYEISSYDYLNKVRPFEEILPMDLRNDIYKFHMISGYKPELNKYLPRCLKFAVDSVLINHRHMVLFANWIKRNEGHTNYPESMMPYEFKLLFRASRDGFDRSSFDSKYYKASKGPSIVIMKVKNSKQIIGGYNPLDWQVGLRFGRTPDSFIFSFMDHENIRTGKLGRVIQSQRAISRTYPFLTNKVAFDSDLVHLKDSKWKSETKSYPNVNIPKKFEIDDYEVFQVKPRKTKEKRVLLTRIPSRIFSTKK